MLCVSTTPGTRRAAAATRSLGASPPALGSTWTVTCAGPMRDRTASSTSSMVWWLRSSPSSLDTPMVTSAKLSPAASRTRTDRTSVTPGTVNAACSITRVRPIGALSIRMSTFRAARRTAATSTSAATHSAATASPRG